MNSFSKKKREKKKKGGEEFPALSVLGMTHTPMSPNGLHISGRKALAYASYLVLFHCLSALCSSLSFSFLFFIFAPALSSRTSARRAAWNGRKILAKEILRDIPPLCFYDSKKLPRLAVIPASSFTTYVCVMCTRNV